MSKKKSKRRERGETEVCERVLKQREEGAYVSRREKMCNRKKEIRMVSIWMKHTEESAFKKC